MNVIETQDLTRRFGRTEALQDLTFSLPQGSACALLGPNGAGKSTTIKLLLNLLRPTDGHAQVLGVDSRRLGPAELARVGYVSENQQLPWRMTVRQLVDYCRPLYPTWDCDLEDRLIDQFQLPPDRKLQHLSRGMATKAALLVSLAYRPALVILDEPFSGLDPLTREAFVQGILEVSRAGDWTLLISAHDIHEIEHLVDRVALLDRGRLQFHEASESLQARFRRVEVDLYGGQAAPLENIPATWLGAERAGDRIRFVDSAFSPEASETALRQRFPSATCTASPMSLREIFLAVTRNSSVEQSQMTSP